MDRLAVSLVALLSCACESGSVYGNVGGSVGGSVGGHASSGHSATSSVTSGAASSTSGAGTSGTTAGATGTSAGSTAGTGAGTTSGMGTKLICANVTLNACDAGEVQLLGQVVDSLTDLPITNPVAVQDVVDPSIVGVSGMNGLLSFCFPPNTLVAAELSVSGYTTMVFSDVFLATSDCVAHLPLFSNAAWGIVEQNLTTIDTSKSEVVVSVNRAVGNPPPYCTQDGWVFQLVDLDGGPVAAQVVYFAGTSVSPNQWTGANGLAVFYDVDPSVSVVRVIGAQIDAGLPCGRAAQEEYTGTVHLLPNGVVSSLEFVITDAGS